MNKDKLLSANRLEQAILNDPFGLLGVNPLKSKNSGDTELLSRRHFEEVNAFVNRTGRVPLLNSKDMNEVRLAAIIQAIQSDKGLSKELSDIDRFGLLKEYAAINESQLSSDPLLNCGNTTGILTLRHVERSSRINPATIAHRHRCENFNTYQPKFNEIKNGLKNGLYEIVEFKEKDLVEGGFYSLNGIITFVEWIHTEERQFLFNSCDRIRKDGPVHAVFDNGTESNMLYRSLVKALQVPQEGYTIKPIVVKASVSPITDSDKLTGHIYVLRSKSKDSNICSIKDLYKIGFSKYPVATRIQNAEHESTYLRAPVQVLRDVEVYNLNAHSLEGQIHAFFGACNPSFTVLGEDGKQHNPKEWFVVPLEIIDKAIEIIASGHGAEYHYVPSLRQIVRI